MINFENGLLVLSNIIVSKEDVEQVNAYIDHVRNEERERFIKLLHDYGTMNYISESTYHELVALVRDSVY